MKTIVLYEPAAKLYLTPKGGLVTDINKAKLYTFAEAGDMINILKKHGQHFEMKEKK